MWRNLSVVTQLVKCAWLQIHKFYHRHFFLVTSQSSLKAMFYWSHKFTGPTILNCAFKKKKKIRQFQSLLLGLTWGKNSINKFLSGYFPILIFIDSPEEVHHPRFLVIHPSHVFFAPDIKIEISKFPQLKRAKVILAELMLHSNYILYYMNSVIFNKPLDNTHIFPTSRKERYSLAKGTFHWKVHFITVTAFLYKQRKQIKLLKMSNRKLLIVPKSQRWCVCPKVAPLVSSSPTG